MLRQERQDSQICRDYLQIDFGVHLQCCTDPAHLEQESISFTTVALMLVLIVMVCDVQTIVWVLVWLLPVHDATQWLATRPSLPPIAASHPNGKQAALSLQRKDRVVGGIKGKQSGLKGRGSRGRTAGARSAQRFL